MAQPDLPGPDPDHYVRSPCVRVCVLDKDTGLCRGCQRTMDEIVRWPSMDAAGRRDVLAAVEARRR